MIKFTIRSVSVLLVACLFAFQYDVKAQTRVQSTATVVTDSAALSVGTIGATTGTNSILVSGTIWNDSDNSGRSVTVTDNQSNVYIVDIFYNETTANENSAFIAHSHNAAAGVTQITVTPTGTGVNDSYYAWSAEEWSDLTNAATQATGVVPSGASDTPTTSGSTSSTPVLLYAALSNTGNGNYTEPTGWSVNFEEQNSAHETGQGAYFIDSGATGVKSANWQATPAGAAFTGVIAAFGVDSGGGGGGLLLRRRRN